MIEVSSVVVFISLKSTVSLSSMSGLVTESASQCFALRKVEALSSSKSISFVDRRLGGAGFLNTGDEIGWRGKIVTCGRKLG